MESEISRVRKATGKQIFQQFSPGIESRLDHFTDLGVETLWLSPAYRSPQKDFGYDISDFRDIDPIYGTLEDFDDLVAAIHERGAYDANVHNDLSRY